MTLQNGMAHINLYTKEFVDALSHPHCSDARVQLSMIEHEPALLPEPWANALLAGLAEMVAQRVGAPAPAWTEGNERFLPAALIFGYTPQVRALMLVETPGPMRRRNLFCGHVDLQSQRWKGLQKH